MEKFKVYPLKFPLRILHQLYLVDLLVLSAEKYKKCFTLPFSVLL